MPCPFEYPDVSVLWRALRAAGPMQGAIQSVGEAPIREAVQQAIGPFESRAGIRLENQFKYTVGRV